jgi:hypothetical protein
MKKTPTEGEFTETDKDTVIPTCKKTMVSAREASSRKTAVDIRFPPLDIIFRV